MMGLLAMSFERSDATRTVLRIFTLCSLLPVMTSMLHHYLTETGADNIIELPCFVQPYYRVVPIPLPIPWYRSGVRYKEIFSF